MKNLLFGFALCALFAACADDDVKVTNSAVANEDGSYCAYLTITLQDVNDGLSRATAGDFEYGTNEQTIHNAFFYFYDEDGEYVTSADVWNGGNANNADPTENIEFKGNTVVVLEGLTSNTYPTYMLTVLNQEEDFVPATTITGLEKQLSSETGEGIYYQDGDEYFKMSTSSYSSEDNAYYFLNTLVTDNFELEPVSDPTNPVVVYVERLAAKVTVQTSMTAATEIPTTLEGKTLYELHTTIADGEVNEGDNEEAYETLYIEFLGWTLNATANHSNIVKNIDAMWSDTLLSELTWNDASNFRSYWGMSFNYSEDDYPESSSEVGSDGVSTYLTYVSLSDATNDFNTSAYCPENTNTAGVVTNNYPRALTHVLLSAQFYDEEGANPTLVRYMGMLFNEEQYLKYVLGAEDLKDKLEYYRKVDDSTYVQIDETYIALQDEGDGMVSVVLTDEASSETWYKSDGTTTATITDLAADLLTDFGKVTIYNDGQMYYCIPIEHLNNPMGDDIEEGQYGVVRNHHYVVTITSLSGLGEGVYDPDEIVVPQEDERDIDLYYVGAQINVLSWKVVSQEVDL